MIALALAIGALVLITQKQISQGTIIALLVFLVLGAIVPPAAFIIGVAVLIGLLYRANAPQAFATWLASVTAGGAPNPPPVGPQAFSPAQGPLVVSAPRGGNTA